MSLRDREAAQAQGRVIGYSLLRTSPMLVVLAIVAADAINYANTDLWLHIVIGRITLATHHIPTVDFFSYTVAGHHVRDHEWLAEVALVLVWRTLGSLGLRLFKLLCVAATVVALTIAIGSTGASARVQRTVLLLTAAALAPFTYLFRPDLFTLTLLGVEIALLSFEAYRGGATLWPMIPMFALWANLHGGFVAGLGALGVFAMAVLARDAMAGNEIRRGMQLLGLTAVCALATLANPFGVGAWRTVLLSAANSVLYREFPEWAPLWSRIVFDLRTTPAEAIVFVLPLALIAAAAFVLLKARTGDDLPLVAVAAVFVAAAFETTRNLPLAVIVLAAPLARHAALARRPTRAKDPVCEASDSGPNAIALGAFALVLAMIGGEISTARLRVAPPSPVGAVAFMKKHGLHGNILNEYRWGNYLMWHTYPRSRVFIDGRLQLAYSENFVRRYFAFNAGDPQGKSVLDDYPNDLVLVRPQSGAFRLVSADPRWRLVYRDGVSALFVKSSSKTARAFPRPEIAKAPRSLFP